MHLMLQADEPDDFVVSTGEAHTVQEFVECAFDAAGIKDWKNYVTIDPLFKRPAEVPNLLGKSDKAKKKLGWSPKVTFPELVKMMVEADLKRYETQKRNDQNTPQS